MLTASLNKQQIISIPPSFNTFLAPFPDHAAPYHILGLNFGVSSLGPAVRWSQSKHVFWDFNIFVNTYEQRGRKLQLIKPLARSLSTFHCQIINTILKQLNQVEIPFKIHFNIICAISFHFLPSGRLRTGVSLSKFYTSCFLHPSHQSHPHSLLDPNGAERSTHLVHPLKAQTFQSEAILATTLTIHPENLDICYVSDMLPPLRSFHFCSI
jgi:hypothetical protein